LRSKKFEKRIFFVCLQAIGQDLAFEIAVGMNGRVFVKSAHPETTIQIAAAIQNSEYLNDADTVAMVKNVCTGPRKKI
jgi:exosome complex component RRP40